MTDGGQLRFCGLPQALFFFVMENESDVFYRELPKVVSHTSDNALEEKKRSLKRENVN